MNYIVKNSEVTTEMEVLGRNKNAPLSLISTSIRMDSKEFSDLDVKTILGNLDYEYRGKVR